mmetsp:Transcript_60308/g.155346  ORF Transcript_60308/g.155346 Transcript_60308/m.155346 type:complete len:491 (-) Transcript_60308:78-1550(-)
MAHLLAERHGRSVVIIDPNASKPWPNNYGVWQEEWDTLEAMLQVGLNECLDTQWALTDCYFGGSWDVPTADRVRLNRAYARVDRNKLKAKLASNKVKVIAEGVTSKVVATNIYEGGLRHDAEGSTLTLASGKTLRAKSVVDCTGAESKLTRRLAAKGESTSPLPGYQIAYGFEGIIEGNTHYDPAAMTLFDYRTDHLSSDPAWEKRAEESPTFMYVMPLGPVPGESNAQRVFFEETSLVARPAVSFEECKKRCFARLDYLGVKVRPGTIADEEFCYIPMGGELPEPGQRTIAFGGAAAMVHPSTGYQLCRMMSAASDVATTIGQQLAQPGISPDAIAGAAYDTIWSPKNQAQRAFAVFGGEFLMELDVEGLRGWFLGFFQLPTDMWAGFLAGWPKLPGNSYHESWYERLWFGLQLVVKIPPPVALRLVKGILGFTLTYGFSLFRSVTPLFGEPPSYLWSAPVPEEEVGDVAAKNEARAMIAAGKKEKVNA